jgi:hypothetical protein
MTGGPAAAEWVSVSDAMPKIGAQCLIRQEKCAYFTCACFEDLGNGTYGWSASFDAGDKRPRPVTHWALIHQPEEFEQEQVPVPRAKKFIQENDATSGIVGDKSREPKATYANRQIWTKCIPAADVEKVRAMSETMTDQEIGSAYGCSRFTVIDYRAAHGIKKRKGKRKSQTDDPSPTSENAPKARGWSPEARASAAERMRQRQAAKRGDGTLGEAQALR